MAPIQQVCIDDFVKNFFRVPAYPRNIDAQEFEVNKFPNYFVDSKRIYSVDSFCIFKNKPIIMFSTKKNGWNRLYCASYSYGVFENKFQIGENENKFIFTLLYISFLHKIFPNCDLFKDNLDQGDIL